jgi:hypothetical protein
LAIYQCEHWRVGFLRRQAWWLAPELLILCVLALAMVLVRGNAFQNQLSDRAELALEQATSTQFHLHQITPGQTSKVICAAESFGTEPPGAQRIEEVRVIYANYLCAAAVQGTPWDYASRSAGPVMITLSDPPTVTIAESGEGYPERVRALIPDNLESRAFAGFVDKGRPSALRTQYDDEVK